MLPTALLESLPTLLEREVEPGLAAETSAAAVSDGLEDAKGGGRGTRLVLVPCRFAIMELARSTLVRAAITY